MVIAIYVKTMTNHICKIYCWLLLRQKRTISVINLSHHWLMIYAASWKCTLKLFMTNQAMHPAVKDIYSLFFERGMLAYGEAVTQTAHALQCGTLAVQDDASTGLVIAAFLHDIGHMLHQDAASAVEQAQDDTHQILGAKWLARWFGPEVHEPVRLHVQAKRYLCHVQPDYLPKLSSLSKFTLQIQGGPMRNDEAKVFEKVPFFEESIRLRRWDDAGKLTAMNTLSIEHFMNLVETYLRTHNWVLR